MKQPSETDYIKLPVFPNGMKCPSCGGAHFHPHATILPTLLVLAPDKTSPDGKVKLWIARSECLTEGCNDFIDWTFHPDKANGTGNEYISIIDWDSKEALKQFDNFPRSKNNSK